MPRIDPEHFLSDGYAFQEFRGRARSGSTRFPKDYVQRGRRKQSPASWLVIPDVSRHSTNNHLRELQKSVPSEDQMLIERFMAHHGPISVREAASLHADDPGDNELSRAVGITFERLAYLWMTDAPIEGCLVLDPASCSRAFSQMKLGFVPDSAIITQRKATQLEHLFEFKMNPSKDVKSLRGQIERMDSFATQQKGKIIKPPWPIIIDKVRNITASRISISPHLQIFVVAPQDRTIPDEFNEKIRQLHTPFRVSFVAEVAKACLSDGAETRALNNSRGFR